MSIQEQNQAGVTLLHTFPRHLQSIHRIAWSPDGSMIASTSGRTLRIWNVASRSLIHALQHQGEVHTVA